MPNPFKRRQERPRVAGAVRVNQLLNTYGVGAIVDFVKDTVMIAGVDEWKEEDGSLRIDNENLSALTGAKYFMRPKVDSSPDWRIKSRDIPSYLFPEKLYCPKCKSLIDMKELQYQQKPHNCFLSIQGKQCNGQLVASRFVVQCQNGHIDDFPYSWWVHAGKDCVSGKESSRIKMYNVGGRSDIDSLMLECTDCNTKRPMASAFQEHAFSGEYGYPCHGRHPHLPEYGLANHEPCDENLKTRLRSSSGVYFPVTQSALSIPPWSERAVRIIQATYDALQYMDSEQAKAYIRQKLVPKAPKPILYEDLLEAYNLVREHKQNLTIRSIADIYYNEYSILCRGTLPGDDQYSAQEVACPELFSDYFEKIVAVDRLTVVQALCGFTREMPWSGEDQSDRRIVPLSIQKKVWLPAIQMNGEGIFIQLKSDSVKQWANANGSRYLQMEKALEESYLRLDRFSPEYVLLHTFAHLFIRAIANHCGYSAASLNEKIYCTFHDDTKNRPKMLGILIYLASSDSDGSLGGLISIAQEPMQLKSILESMLHDALWCSADPLCGESTRQGFLSLNYAACHDCVLLPETSCEFRNVLLDRISVVGKPDKRRMGFMGEAAQSL